MNHLKLLFVGPSRCGKTYLSNFLSESIEQMSGDYRPTQGVRIVEYETDLTAKGKKTKVEIEIWDVSGDNKFEGCWPAIMKDTNGVIMVYNQDQSNHEKELENWYMHFVQNQGLKDHHCCIISHKMPSTADRDIVQLPSIFDNIRNLKSNIAESGDTLREDFNRFLNQLLSKVSETREQEELNIMNS